MSDIEFPSQSDLIATPGTIGGQPSDDSEEARRVTDVVESLREEFRDRDKVLEDIEMVVSLETSIKIPAGYKKTALEVRSPLAAHTVNTITSALSVNPPATIYDQVGIGDRALENQSLRQAFFDASWERQQTEAQRPLFRQLCYSDVAYGEAICKTMERSVRVWASYGAFQKDLKAKLDRNDALTPEQKDVVYDAKTEEFKRGAAYPLVSTDVPPNQFYYVRGEDGFTCCVEVKQIPYLEAVERFQVGVNSEGTLVPGATGLSTKDCYKALGNRRTIEVLEVWDWEKVSYLVRGTRQKDRKKGLLVKTVKHGYGDAARKVLRGPYFHAMGITTSSRELYKQSQSVLFPFLSLFPLLDQLLTIRGQAAVTYGFGAFKRNRPPGGQLGDASFGVDAGERDGAEEEIRPGYIYPDDIAPIAMPAGGPDLDKAIADVRAMIELALPSAAQGMGGGDSGYAINQAAHLARLAWNPIITNLEQMLAERVSFESWLIQNRIQEKVWVYGSIPEARRARRPRRARPDEGWLGVDGDDLDGLHRYRVRLRAETPSNEVIDIRMESDKLKMGVTSLQKATQALGGDPWEIEQERMFEALKQDPAVLGMVKQAVFQRLATFQQQALQSVDAAPPTGAAPPPDAQQQMAPPSPDALAAAAAGSGSIPIPPPGQGQGAPGVPGTPIGAPGGIPSVPMTHQPLPGDA